MAIDLSKLSDEDLDALESGDLTKLSDEALDMLEAGEQAPVVSKPAVEKPIAPQPKPSVSKPRTALPRDPRIPADIDPARGASALLGIPGSMVRTARGLTSLVGAEDTSAQLAELERKIKSRAPSEGAYQFGQAVSEIVPYGLAAKGVSMLPIASRMGMGAAQALGQAGTAYAISPEDRAQAAILTGTMGALGEVAVPAYQLAKRGITRARQLLSTTGPVGATPAEEAAVRIAREKAPGREQVEAELAAAREAERVKQEEAARLKAKYLESEKNRLAQKADLERRQIEAKDERVRVKSDADKAVAEAAAKRDAAKEKVQDRIQQIRDQEAASQKVLEEANIREAAADAKPVLEDRASEFRNLARQLKEEADAAKAVSVEPPPVRPKQSRAIEFRDLILGRRDRLKQAREDAIGRDVDPITGEVQEAPFLKTALQKESAGQTISDAPKFQKLVDFVRNRAEDASRYGDEVRRAHAKLLSELQPVKETVGADGELTSEVIPIKFEKLWEERRRIEKARTGDTATGYEAITEKTRESLLKTIDDALDQFGSGYKDFNKKYSESSRPLDEFEFGVGEKATETRKFSRDNFVNNPETVLDTALSKPSQSSAQQLKASYFDEADYDKLDNIILESLTEQAGNTPKGYDRVLNKYGEFLKEFPAANETLRRQADEVTVAFGEAEKTAAFKERWAKRVEARADKAEKAISSISGLQSQVKSSLTSPLKEGSLDQIGAFVRSNPKMREKVGAALSDVLNSMDDKLIEQSLSIPERQAAFMRAGMSREQVDSVLANSRLRLEERANNLAEVKAMRGEQRQAQKEAKAAQAAAKEQNEAAAEKVRQTGRELQKADEGRKAEELAKKQAEAEFASARALRVDAETKRRAIGQLTPDMRDAINIEAEKIPLNTTEGLARATTLATILSGVGGVISGNTILGGILAAGTAAAGATGRRILIKKQQKQIADEIENIVSKILKDDTGGVVSAIEGKIARANDVAAAQRIANKALAQLGYKPGVGAVTSNVIYNAYAKEPEPEEEPAAAPAEEPVANEAEPYSYESLTSEQKNKLGQYLTSLGLNKDFLMNAQNFNATPLEKRQKLFAAIQARNMARGGPVYTPAEQDLLRRYADGGPTKRPTLPADRYAGYKQVGESDDRLLRFFEAAVRELPDAIKQNVTSNADLAAKYLKFKFGMMSPDEMMQVARALPESLKGAALAAMQAVKEAPKAAAEATPESAGKFAGQMLAGEITDPLRMMRGTSAITKPVIQELDVYHGTPHRFPATEANPLGEFDASKIGTGEGAQAYGHGIYLAENPKVAGSYREASWRDEELVKKLKTPSLTQDEYATLGELARKSHSGIEQLSKAEEKTLAKLRRQQIRQAKELFAARKAAGSLYKADLPDEMIGQMLDYDKPLSKQPKAIQEAVKQFGDFEPSDSGKFVMESIASGLRIKDGSPTGRRLWFPYSTPESIAKERIYPAKIAEKLKTAGIPGIVYRDAGSRGKRGSGTRNFVVFPGEEKKVRILERK